MSKRELAEEIALLDIPAVYSKEDNRVRHHIMMLKRFAGTLENYFELKLDDPVTKFLSQFDTFQSCGRAVYKELTEVISQYESFRQAIAAVRTLNNRHR